MANTTGFKNLIFWKEAKILVVLVYKLTNRFPRSEEFGLKSQMRRAAVSILSNFAEGWQRKSVKEKYRYLEISQGSIMELDAQGEIAFEVQGMKYLTNCSNNKNRRSDIYYRVI